MFILRFYVENNPIEKVIEFDSMEDAESYCDYICKVEPIKGIPTITHE